MPSELLDLGLEMEIQSFVSAIHSSSNEVYETPWVMCAKYHFKS